MAKKKTIYHLTKGLRDRVDAFIMRQSLLPDQAVFDPAIMPWVGMLERHWGEIRDEALRVGVNDIPSLGDISPDHGRIAADRRWRSFFLEGYGYKRQENRARVPLTAALIDRIPDLCTASFSVLEAGCHIPRHRGMTKGMLTYHLALRVPDDRKNCWIQIEEGTHMHVCPWTDGHSLLFDDTYNHEVWNNTGQDRYVLLIQVRRPCRWPARLLMNLFFTGVRYSRFVQDIRRNLDCGS
ncbi:aspartyl beta-hydroxylase [Komagataeibacter rhaeticus]|uniref:Aspartyl/asparaginyl beta-hydroxylase domain-containing protein n=1 Tax=Komagataeibacter rhaeticus TaxID=215221 RepID=A0A181CA50_9PROT|nr:aspartyl/asparaginyl beta-hydroxylase domain-containing protein [Komagataeibacter rhaeticus]ATU73033.1 aspartyl/asparaginyl beta-hydroxylase domain-containing protein [Komagataeibacter xylinus]EGG77158.1 Aspartyl/asparaginyl beta-hydroxylase [Gluconacetobacter sp. SXCC-1]KDU97433.1 aspartyl beta-hydroxylase [Komagataeibacter rhaeticus AF1]MBL7238982.1 aspartyl/asparaginyl beta-hydroxylase domain-containing protein [Komagataeibacter rhaeticus]PYD54253.1 aspartyl beta-hydroxylase [Komagataeib